MKNRTSISVIIPTIGRHRQLPACLESLSNQTILPKEIIIVDNSNQSNLNQILQEIQKTYLPQLTIKCIRESRRGVAFARNAGIKTAKYDLVAFIDDDCAAEKKWVQKIVDFYKTNSRAILHGRSLNGFPDNLFACVEHFGTETFFRTTNFLDTKNFAFNKAFFTKLLYFDTRFSHIYEDVDFGLRAKEKRIKVVRNPNLKVTHYARSNFFGHFKREFNKGQDYYRFQKKWHKLFLKNKKLQIILKEIRKNKVKRIKERSRREILRDKSVLFNIFFRLLLFLDKLIIKLGFYFESIIHEFKMCDTRNFLPRNMVFTKRSKRRKIL